MGERGRHLKNGATRKWQKTIGHWFFALQVILMIETDCWNMRISYCISLVL